MTEIRPLRKTDDPLAVARVYVESWRSAYRDIVPQPYLDALSPGRWAGGLDRDGHQSLVLIQDGIPVGTAAAGPSRWPGYPDFGEIVSLYLLPDRVGKGWGRPLLAAAVETLAAQGFRDILLWVLAENARARSFYERNGFQPGGDRMESVIGGKPLEEALYLRHLE